MLALWDALRGKRMDDLRPGLKMRPWKLHLMPRDSLWLQTPQVEQPRVYITVSRKCMVTLERHDGEISKIWCNAHSTHPLTTSSDKTSRLWDPHTGQRVQVMEQDTDEFYSCAFNCERNSIITGSKDNMEYGAS